MKGKVSNESGNFLYKRVSRRTGKERKSILKILESVDYYMKTSIILTP